jgi:multiple sugar transport system permease protein
MILSKRDAAPGGALAEVVKIRRPFWHAARRALLARVVLIAFALFFLMPFYWMFTSALKSNQELSQFPPTFFPQEWHWESFGNAVNYIPFFQFLRNTLIITVLSTVGAVISNPIIAYGFSRISWKYRDTIFYLVVATIFIPYPVIMVGLFDVFARLGWINTFLPLIVPAFFGNAFYIFILRQFMLQIPQDLSDAARIDGANEAQILWQVILPLVRPAITVVAIFSIVGAWNDFLAPLIYLQDDSLYTLAIGLQYFRSTHSIEFNLLMAASTLIVLPIVVLFLLFQRFFVEGIAVSGLR